MAKNVQDVVIGMLSTAGAATRHSPQPDPEPALAGGRARSRSAPAAAASRVQPPPGAPATPAPPARAVDAIEAPRTLRLRPETAALLREAWVEAKHHDVFLTAQDFASNLLEEALAAHRRRRTSTA